MVVKRMLRKLRMLATSWIEQYTPQHVEDIRRYELELVLLLLPDSGKVLEIGAGAGWQAQLLAERGYVVSAIDLPSSNYIAERMWPITEYDGSHIPFGDSNFDVVFSSNVLEHIRDAYSFHKEIHRVLKHDGCAIHVLPSASWRFWTNITHVIKHWNVPPVHGAHAKNALTEMVYFSR